MERHYSEEYFFSERRGGIKWTDPKGEKREFGYRGGGVWDFQSVYIALKSMLGTPKSVLDAGSGCGGWIATLAKNGVDAHGLEFSRFAVDNLFPGARDRVKLWDVTESPWPAESADWVTAIDLFEHVFDSRVDAVIGEAKRAAKHFIIAKICTAQLPHEVWAAKEADLKDVLEQAEREGYTWLVVSGHVNSQTPQYWRAKFEDSEWRIRDDLSDALKRSIALPEDWRTTLIVERIPKDYAPLPEAFTSAYYDERYFADPVGKTYRDRAGQLQSWGYKNPTGEWSGCAPIAEAWKTMFQPRNLLDAGAGRGQFTAAAREVGIEAVGFDYSEYAVGPGRYHKCKPEWLIQHDATRPWPWKSRSFDLVIALDLLEHVYDEDLSDVLGELLRVSDKWVFVQIAVAGSGGTQGADPRGYSLRRGEPVPPELEENVVAGHINVRPAEYWVEKFDRPDFIVRRDMVEWFKGLVPADMIRNWTANLILVAERV